MRRKPQTMADIVAWVLDNSSRAEVAKMAEGAYDVAAWLVERLLPDLTPNQVETVSYRVLDTVSAEG